MISRVIATKAPRSVRRVPPGLAALADVHESIEELRYYRRTFLRADPAAPDTGPDAAA